MTIQYTNILTTTFILFSLIINWSFIPLIVSCNIINTRVKIGSIILSLLFIWFNLFDFLMLLSVISTLYCLTLVDLTWTNYWYPLLCYVPGYVNISHQIELIYLDLKNKYLQTVVNKIKTYELVINRVDTYCTKINSIVLIILNLTKEYIVNYLKSKKNNVNPILEQEFNEMLNSATSINVDVNVVNDLLHDYEESKKIQ